MAKPPTSVRSIRLPDSVWGELRLKAEAAGLSLNAYVADCLARPGAYRERGFQNALNQPPTTAPRPDGSLVAARAFTPKAGEKFRGVTASGEPLPIRKPYQKGGKK